MVINFLKKKKKTGKNGIKIGLKSKPVLSGLA